MGKMFIYWNVTVSEEEMLVTVIPKWCNVAFLSHSIAARKRTEGKSG